MILFQTYFAQQVLELTTIASWFSSLRIFLNIGSSVFIEVQAIILSDLSFAGKVLTIVQFKTILRLVLVSGLKWVDEVIANSPYAITEKFMKSLFNEHKIDYIIHGDDPCLLPDGTDAYALAKKAGRYKQIKRTEGVSSTDIVGSVVILSAL